MQTIAIRRDLKILEIKCSLSKMPILSKNVSMARQKLQKKQLNVSSKISEVSYGKTTSEIHQVLPSTYSFNHFQEKYVMGKKIGEGANGLVRKCYHSQRKKTYAVKTTMIDEEDVPGLKKNFWHIQKLKHPSIVNYKCLYIDLTKHLSYLVMEYIELPSLLDFLQNEKKPIRNQAIKWIFYELFKVLAYLHSKNICHRDIKPENILVDSSRKKIKLIDFGISKSMEIRKNKASMYTITGTLFYRAPQMFQGEGYNEKVDMWAAGITLFKVLTGKTPFESEFHSETIDKICNGPLSFHDSHKSSLSNLLKNLIIHLLSKSPTQRLSAVQAYKNLWFDDILERSRQSERRRARSQNPKDHLITQYSKFVPKLKQVSEGLLYMKDGVDKINGADFHHIETNNF